MPKPFRKRCHYKLTSANAYPPSFAHPIIPTYLTKCLKLNTSAPKLVIHDLWYRLKRGHPFFHGLGVSMLRPFRKGIACHPTTHMCPFCSDICYFIIWCRTLYFQSEKYMLIALLKHSNPTINIPKGHVLFYTCSRATQPNKHLDLNVVRIFFSLIWKCIFSLVQGFGLEKFIQIKELRTSR